jgi:hypothetical protein
MELVLGLRYRSVLEAVTRRILAALPLTLGLNWACIYTSTVYRAHHRPVILPLAIVLIFLGLGLSHLWIYRR